MFPRRDVCLFSLVKPGALTARAPCKTHWQKAQHSVPYSARELQKGYLNFGEFEIESIILGDLGWRKFTVLPEIFIQVWMFLLAFVALFATLFTPAGHVKFVCN